MLSTRFITSQPQSTLDQMEDSIKTEVAAQISDNYGHINSVIMEASGRIMTDTSRRVEGALTAIDSRMDSRLELYSTRIAASINKISSSQMASNANIQHLSSQVYKQTQRI